METTQTVDRPPKMSVLLLIVLVLVTLGLFAPIWFLIRKDWLNRLSATRKLGSGLAYASLVLICISAVLGVFVPMIVGVTIGALDDLLWIAGWVCLVILAFRVERILIQHYIKGLGLNVGFDGAATFLFNLYYLQYKMNRLPVLAEVSVDLAESGQERHTQE